MPDLAAVPWGAITAPGMLFVAVWLILTGRIVPRSTHQDARDDRDQWKAAHGRSEEARGLLLEELRRTTTALERLAGSKDLSVALLRSVRRETTSGTTEQEDT